jgi:hypothetical protein
MVYGVYTMDRKQIYIAEEQEVRLKQIAEREHTTVSALIRDAVNVYLETRGAPDVAMEEHPLWSIVGLIDDDGAPTDGSMNYKRELYGREI